jgi:hypothetical protein
MKLNNFLPLNKDLMKSVEPLESDDPKELNYRFDPQSFTFKAFDEEGEAVERSFMEKIQDNKSPLIQGSLSLTNAFLNNQETQRNDRDREGVIQNIYGTTPIWDYNEMYGDNTSGGSQFQPIIKAEKGAKVRTMLEASAPINVEKGEFIILPDGTTELIRGKKHKDGGVNTILPEGSIIYSNKLKPMGDTKTFAQKAKDLDFNKYLEILKNPFSDPATINTATKMIDRNKKKLATLFQDQQMMNGDSSGEPMMMKGGYTEYEDGGTTQNPQMFPFPSLDFQKKVQENIAKNSTQPSFVRREPIVVSQTDNTRTNTVDNGKINTIKTNRDKVDSLHNNLSYQYTDEEQELVNKYSKTEKDKEAYKYFKEKTQDKKWKEEYINAVGNIALETFTDQLPQIAKKFRSNPYINETLKLPHLNKIKALKDFVYDGRPITALSDLLKIPKFSNIGVDALINIAQENPKGFDIKTLEDKVIPTVRLAGLKNEQVISEIGKEIMRSGETKNSSWKSREFNLPDLTTASKKYEKLYGTSQNDLVEFIENYMVGRGKTYKQTLEAFEKYNNNKMEYGGMIKSMMEDGGIVEGQELDLTEEQIEQLKKQGFKFDIL